MSWSRLQTHCFAYCWQRCFGTNACIFTCHDQGYRHIVLRTVDSDVLVLMLAYSHVMIMLQNTLFCVLIKVTWHIHMSWSRLQTHCFAYCWQRCFGTNACIFTCHDQGYKHIVLRTVDSDVLVLMLAYSHVMIKVTNTLFCVLLTAMFWY